MESKTFEASNVTVNAADITSQLQDLDKVNFIHYCYLAIPAMTHSLIQSLIDINFCSAKKCFFFFFFFK